MVFFHSVVFLFGVRGEARNGVEILAVETELSLGREASKCEDIM